MPEILGSIPSITEKRKAAHPITPKLTQTTGPENQKNDGLIQIPKEIPLG